MLRPRATIRVRPTVRPTVRARRPPPQYVATLCRSEAELREHIRELEQGELFRALVRQGAVARRGLRGRIPQGAYEEYMDRQLIEFVREYHLDRHPHWREDFLHPDALSRLGTLAEKYGCPPATVARHVRYLRAISSPRARLSGAPAASEEAPADISEYAAGPQEVDVSDAAGIAQDFVACFGLTQSDFIRDFMHGDEGAEVLAERYGAPLADVRRLLAAIDRVQIADSAAAEAVVVTGAGARAGAVDEAPRIIGEVVVPEDGEPSLVLNEQAGYGLHYRIDPQAIRPAELGAPAGQVEELLAQLRWINQRRSLVCRLAAFLCSFQSEFLRSGSYLDLKPISQAEVARQLGEHQSTVSRAIRDKYVASPHGRFELRFLCQRKADVIARLVSAHPGVPDREMQRLLAERYGCQISRRTVNHHRNQLRKRQASRGQ